MADTISRPRSQEPFVAEVNAAASRAAAASRTGRSVGARSSFWIALGEVAQGRPGRAGTWLPGMLADTGRRVWRAVLGLASRVRQALGGKPTALPYPESADTEGTPMWAVDALLPAAVLGALGSWAVPGGAWAALATAGVVVLPVAVGILWQSRARAARQRNAALDAYADREIARRARRRRVARSAP
jgi:hypothetical protein